jgi:SAM-dependent methyltransferase
MPSDELRRQFAQQAATFDRPGYVFTDADVLAWIDAHTPVSQDDRILDVAGGTGALGKHLVQRGRSCVVLDLVPEMLAAGAAEGRRDVLFVQGDAARLPFADAQFDLVVTRFAVHHMDDPAAAFREMARVAVPGGRVTAIDMVDGGHRHNELERLRDPSHTAALSRERLSQLLAAAGIVIDETAEREHRMDARAWLEQAQGERERVAKALEAEAAGGPPTGLRATRDDGSLRIAQTWMLLTGTVGEFRNILR